MTTSSPGVGATSMPASRDISPQLWDSTLTFYVNGNEVTISNPDPSMHLVDYLRDVACLKATKVCARLL
jgi:xanthine dehydrogenase iron-sulfur cluster and FAD-binding subunit A